MIDKTVDLFRKEKINANQFISHRFTKNQVPDIFAKINDPNQQVIKAMITLAEWNHYYSSACF